MFQSKGKKRWDLRVHLPGYITRLFPRATWRLQGNGNKLYLTFDDGPVPEVTPQVLDILRNYGIKATFFCVGENVARYPDLYNQILEEGHATGNHTFHHIKGLKFTNKAYQADIEKAAQHINSNLFRPPYGLISPKQCRYVVGKYHLIMWDVISCDYDKALTPEHCFSNVVDFVRDGSIITFHDSVKASENVLGVLPRLIEYLLNQGYSFDKIEMSSILGVRHGWLNRKLRRIIEEIKQDKKTA